MSSSNNVNANKVYNACSGASKAFDEIQASVGLSKSATIKALKTLEVEGRGITYARLNSKTKLFDMYFFPLTSGKAKKAGAGQQRHSNMIAECKRIRNLQPKSTTRLS